MSDSEAPDQQPQQPAPARRPFWMRLIGWQKRPGSWLPYRPTLWGWLVLFTMVAGGGMAGFAEYSMTPDFCRSCHLMEPYYQAWHASSHKNVNCTQCHFEPGAKGMLWGKFQASSQAVKFITQTYGSKPHAEIQDASCMREGCHEKRLLEGKVNWDVQTSRGSKITIRFDHRPHLTEERRGRQLRCVSCHSQIVQGQHLVVTVDTCFLCHMKGFEHGRNEKTLGGCRNCHEAPKEQIRLATGMFNHNDYLSRGVTCENCHSKVVRGDGTVTRQACWNCHNQEKLVQRFNDTAFLHNEHVTAHKVECSSCHEQIQHTLAPAPIAAVKTAPTNTHPLVPAGACASCHVNMHGGPAELYRGTGARGVPDMPSPMFRTQVDCIACHKTRKESVATAEVTGQTYEAAQDACALCHGAKYDGTLAVWKRQIESLTTTADSEYNKALAIVRGSTSADKEKAQKLLSDAEYNIRFVRLGHGVHNVNYATAVLNAAIDGSKQAAKVVAPPTVTVGDAH